MPAPRRRPCAPPRALCQSPTHRGASLTFRYCCGSSLSCGGATGRSGRGSVSSACQGLCVSSFYGVPRACPLKRITRLAVNLGGGGGAEKGHTRHPRHSGPHTPLPAYHSGPTERRRLREPDRGGAGRGATHSDSRRLCSFSSSRCFSLYCRWTSASRIRKSSSTASMFSKEDFMAYIWEETGSEDAGAHQLPQPRRAPMWTGVARLHGEDPGPSSHPSLPPTSCGLGQNTDTPSAQRRPKNQLCWAASRPNGPVTTAHAVLAIVSSVTGEGSQK